MTKYFLAYVYDNVFMGSRETLYHGIFSTRDNALNAVIQWAGLPNNYTEREISRALDRDLKDFNIAEITLDGVMERA